MSKCSKNIFLRKYHEIISGEDWAKKTVTNFRFIIRLRHLLNKFLPTRLPLLNKISIKNGMLWKKGTFLGIFYNFKEQIKE